MTLTHKKEGEKVFIFENSITVAILAKEGIDSYKTYYLSPNPSLYDEVHTYSLSLQGKVI